MSDSILIAGLCGVFISVLMAALFLWRAICPPGLIRGAAYKRRAAPSQSSARRQEPPALLAEPAPKADADSTAVLELTTKDGAEEESDDKPGNVISLAAYREERQRQDKRSA